MQFIKTLNNDPFNPHSINELGKQPRLTQLNLQQEIENIIYNSTPNSALSYRAVSQLISYLPESKENLIFLYETAVKTQDFDDFSTAYTEIPISTEMLKYGEKQHQIGMQLVMAKMLTWSGKSNSNRLFVIVRELKKLGAVSESEYVERLAMQEMTVKGGIYSQGLQKTKYCKSQRIRRRTVVVQPVEVTEVIEVPEFLKTEEFLNLTLKDISQQDIVRTNRLDLLRQKILKKRVFVVQNEPVKYQVQQQYIETPEFKDIEFPRLQGRSQRFCDTFVEKEIKGDQQLEEMFGVDSRQLLEMQKSYIQRENGFVLM